MEIQIRKIKFKIIFLVCFNYTFSFDCPGTSFRELITRSNAVLTAKIKTIYEDSAKVELIHQFKGTSLPEFTLKYSPLKKIGVEVYFDPSLEEMYSVGDTAYLMLSQRDVPIGCFHEGLAILSGGEVIFSGWIDWGIGEKIKINEYANKGKKILGIGIDKYCADKTIVYFINQDRIETGKPFKNLFDLEKDSCSGIIKKYLIR